MRILLHMGQGKTGTTALQQSLHAAAPALRAKGVLYPRFGDGAIAHHLLLALCGDPRNLTAWTLNALGGPEAAARKARAAWGATCSEIRANPPRLLILSSELLPSGTDRREKARLAEILSSLSGDIRPILYVRHPVAFYRGALQEMLKEDRRPMPPVCQNLREKILDTEAAFPKPPVLIAYDPDTLYQGDTVSDFADRFLAPMIGAVDLPQRRANPGFSAEALVCLAQVRAGAGDARLDSRLLSRLKAQLLDFDRSDPPKAPLTLLPDVAEAALRCATCHRWLAETGRLRIPGLDVDRIDGAPVPDWMLTAAPETLFFHDPDRLARLSRVIDGSGTQPAPDHAPVRKPGLRDRLLRYLNRKILASNDQAAAGRPPRTRKPEADPDDTAS